MGVSRAPSVLLADLMTGARSLRFGFISWVRDEPALALARALCATPALERLAQALVFQSVVRECLAVTLATRAFFSRVEFERCPEKRWNREQVERAKMFKRE